MDRSISTSISISLSRLSRPSSIDGYRYAAASRPWPPLLQAYEAMPIEEFGKAMLRGMGWEDGMGVGRNRKKVRPDRCCIGPC
jgi:hypothetical protein